MGALFDKLNFMRRLEEDGIFTRSQAERLSDVLHDAVGEGVATKQDLADIRTEISQLRLEARASSAEFKVWSVSIGATIVAALAAIKYFG